MLNVVQSAGIISLTDHQLVFAENGYRYALAGSARNQAFADQGLLDYSADQKDHQTLITGRFAHAGLELTQRLRAVDGMIEETITLHNPQPHAVELQSVEFGFLASLDA